MSSLQWLYMRSQALIEGRRQMQRNLHHSKLLQVEIWQMQNGKMKKPPM